MPVTDDLAAASPDAQPDMYNIGLLHTALEGRAEHGRYAPTSLDVLQGIVAKNPMAYEQMNEVSRAIYERRVAYLSFQVQQIENAETGRTGAEPVLDEEGP